MIDHYDHRPNCPQNVRLRVNVDELTNHSRFLWTSDNHVKIEYKISNHSQSKIAISVKEAERSPNHLIRLLSHICC